MKQGRLTLLFAALALLYGAGCTSPAPPYADLPLRDVLGADPEVLASLPADRLEEVAQRLEDRRTADHDEDGVRLAEPTTSAGAVRAIDDARLAAGRDALVVARLGARDGSLVANAVPSQPDEGDVLPDLPALEGAAATETREVEAVALHGHAGRILRGLLRTSHANRLVRVTQWPTGAVAIERLVYVNASWLVALSTLESRDGGPTRVVLLGPAAAPSSIISAQSLRGSPFATYPTLSACVDDVTGRCETCLSSGSCDALATLTDFADGRSECAFLVGDGGSQKAVEELCVFALTSIDSVANCLSQSGCPPPQSSTTSGGLSGADGFLSNGECVRALDVCLSGTDESADAGTPPGLSVSVQTGGCLGPFEACASAFQALGDACNSGRCSGKAGPSCSSCSGCTTCSSCKPSPPGPGPGPVGGSGGSGSGSSGSTGGSAGSSGTTGSGSGSASGGGSGSSGSGSGGSNGGSGGSSGSTSGGGGSRAGSGCSGGGGCSGNGSAGGGGCGSCSGNSGCSSCNGGGSTSSANSGCSCSGGASSGGSTSGSSSSCGSKDCDVAAQSARATDPPVSLFWLALPAFYLGRRARRDARGS